MCNYKRQSKTKPFTFNEFLLEKGRLPQGGILMKQMAECSQGQTLTVLLFTVCQHFQHSEELHLSPDRFLCVSVSGCVCARESKGLVLIDTSHTMDSGENNEEPHKVAVSRIAAAHTGNGTKKKKESAIKIPFTMPRGGVHVAPC